MFLDSCRPTQFQCKVSGECIDPAKKCDGIVNCRDESDEDANAECGMLNTHSLLELSKQGYRYSYLTII